MKRFPVFIATVMMVSAMQAADKLDLKAITSGEFAASYVTGINPIDGTDLYASISNDGKQVISYSFKTGKQMSILFDVNAAKAPFEQIEGYVISPDGKKLLIMTHREAIYRRSFKAEYFVYDIAKKSLKKLSQGVNQQVATWSPDSRHIAFVKDNNLFVTDGDKETQITRDGKFNEVINGIPDWVYEEEFSFNRAFAWNADGTAIGWIRFDESHVKTYSLQMFEGSHPTRSEYHDYPGEYSYKYPKAGQDNSKVSLWSYDMKNGKTVALEVPVDSDGYYPRIKTSPDANSLIVYTMNRHQDDMRLYAVDPFTGKSRMLIKESVPKFVKDEVINGIPDWVYEEEFSFNRAFAWNADGTAIGWIRFDESHVKTYSLQMFEGSHPTHSEYHDYPGEYSYKYPKAGQDNSKVSLWSYDMKNGKTVALDVPVDSDGYYPRIKTSPDANSLIVYTMNRHQDDMRLYAVNPFTGKSRMLIKESVPKFVKEEVIENSIVGKKNILLPSDRDGFMHLYLYDMNGKLLRQVEKGNYDVTSIYGMDEKTGDVYFQAAKLNAHDRQVYVAHKNGKVERLTDAAGSNSAYFSGDYRYFVNTWSSYSHPYVFTVRSNKGKLIKTLEDNKKLLEKTRKYNWGKRETFSFTTSEGVKLDGWMVKPVDFDASKKYPVILFQYSGPGNQQVLDSWSTGSMGNGGAFDYYLAQEGFIIACVDGRGTGGRGAEFEKSTYLRLGDLESKDQVETALYMGSLPYVDKDNIGIWGWSYGGFNTLMSMSEGRPVFKAGVAVAPPTCYRFYDSVYTERYMRTPKENEEGYKVNPIERVKQQHGALLICHGLADDNVHPQNTFEYTEALVQADKDFKTLWYTNRNHGISGGNTRNHLLRQIANWFKQNLK